MAKNKITRKQLLKGTDEFLTLSARATIFVRDHSRQFYYLGGAIIALFLIYLGIDAFMDYTHKKGQEAYNKGYYNFAKNLNPSKVDQEVLKKSEELFQQVIDDYSLSKVSRLAIPQLAYLKFLEKKYGEAIFLYQKFLNNEVSDNSPYQSLARIGLAGCYEAKGELKMAMEILNQIMAGPGNFFKEQAMLSLARVYRLTNHQDKSREILIEFVEKYPSSPFLPTAKAHLK